MVVFSKVLKSVQAADKLIGTYRACLHLVTLCVFSDQISIYLIC